MEQTETDWPETWQELEALGIWPETWPIVYVEARQKHLGVKPMKLPTDYVRPTYTYIEARSISFGTRTPVNQNPGLKYKRFQILKAANGRRTKYA